MCFKSIAGMYEYDAKAKIGLLPSWTEELELEHKSILIFWKNYKMAPWRS